MPPLQQDKALFLFLFSTLQRILTDTFRDMGLTTNLFGSSKQRQQQPESETNPSPNPPGYFEAVYGANQPPTFPAPRLSQNPSDFYDLQPVRTVLNQCRVLPHPAPPEPFKFPTGGIIPNPIIGYHNPHHGMYLFEPVPGQIVVQQVIPPSEWMRQRFHVDEGGVFFLVGVEQVRLGEEEKLPAVGWGWMGGGLGMRRGGTG
ncbi:hypothetical protein BJ508DRAFT_334842 [Ascobolus immersus RN42]|uniref:Uncharacterized protein n=1 Tax=Ascobolus immersus RN42 TaxID=1160509 RepID=A0A3N4HEM3_ASCIM|nr:hypothetical protein BJ508DRAFT_334842 [Ascobolus immersus RN42]